MIDFELKDDNIQKIKTESKLFNLVTKYGYRIYGLRQTEPELINISFDSNTIKIDKDVIKKFLAKNDLKCDIHDEDIESGNKIYIGMRKDLRNHILLASSMLKTLVYYFENRIDGEQLANYNLPPLPKFEKKKEKTEKPEETVTV